MPTATPWSTPNSFRKTIRATPNPLDRATVISILPLAIREVKPTIEPGIFNLAPGNMEKPTFLVVGPSSWWREIDENQPLIEIPTNAIQVADSIVKDYANSMHLSNSNDVVPGLQAIPGEWDYAKLMKEYPQFLSDMNKKQRDWYLQLVQAADVLWSRSSGNPLSISSIMRMAATELGINEKPWLSDIQAMELVNCMACGQMRNPKYPICPSCHSVVDVELAKKLGVALPASK